MDPLFTPSCEAAYLSVFQDASPEDWCWLGYEGQKLKAEGTGTGGLEEMVAKVEDNQILYGLLRLAKTDDGGDSKRIKFIFITWVGESASPLKRGRVTVHKKTCGTLFKGYHIEKQIFERAGLATLAEEIDSDLKKAGGANYDLGNSRSGIQAGQSNEYKSASKKFFENKEKESTIGAVVYDKGPLSKGLTPCDLGGRDFVASHADAKRNIVGYEESK